MGFVLSSASRLKLLQSELLLARVDEARAQILLLPVHREDRHLAAETHVQMTTAPWLKRAALLG